MKKVSKRNGVIERGLARVRHTVEVGLPVVFLAIGSMLAKSIGSLVGTKLGWAIIASLTPSIVSGVLWMDLQEAKELELREKVARIEAVNAAREEATRDAMHLVHSVADRCARAGLLASGGTAGQPVVLHFSGEEGASQAEALLAPCDQLFRNFEGARRSVDDSLAILAPRTTIPRRAAPPRRAGAAVREARPGRQARLVGRDNGGTLLARAVTGSPRL